MRNTTMAPIQRTIVTGRCFVQIWEYPKNIRIFTTARFSNPKIRKSHSYFHQSLIPAGKHSDWIWFWSANHSQDATYATFTFCFFWGGHPAFRPPVLLPNKKKHGPFSLVFGGNHTNIISCLPSSFVDIFGCGCQKQLKSWALFKYIIYYTNYSIRCYTNYSIRCYTNYSIRCYTNYIRCPSVWQKRASNIEHTTSQYLSRYPQISR